MLILLLLHVLILKLELLKILYNYFIHVYLCVYTCNFITFCYEQWALRLKALYEALNRTVEWRFWQNCWKGKRYRLFSYNPTENKIRCWRRLRHHEPRYCDMTMHRNMYTRVSFLLAVHTFVSLWNPSRRLWRTASKCCGWPSQLTPQYECYPHNITDCLTFSYVCNV